MPSKVQNVLKPACRATRHHIIKRCMDNMYDAKVLLGASIALDIYSNTVDYIQIGQNKKINDKDKKYLQAYKLTNSAVLTVMQGAAGLFLLREKTQHSLLKFSEKITGVPVVSKEFDAAKNLMRKNNFRIISTLIGSVLLIKRMIVPFLTTPLTSYVRDHLEI